MTAARRFENPMADNQAQTQAAPKISVIPLVLTTLITTGVSLGIGYWFAQWREKKKREEEELREREREERAAMTPPMPMMWGQSMGMPANAAPKSQTQEISSGKVQQLNEVIENLSQWQSDLENRERHLQMVVGED